MGFRVSTNISAINATRNLGKSQMNIKSSLNRLASGQKINSASDDAAGLAISESLKSQILSVRQARGNANDGISMVQVAEGGLNEISSIVARLRGLGVQASSDTVGNIERGFINKEVQQLKDELERIASVTTWGHAKLLAGTAPDFDFQVGLFNNSREDRISFSSKGNVATLKALKMNKLNFSTKRGAQKALETLDKAQISVNKIRANLGSLQNRLLSTVNNLAVTEENLASARSRIQDTDIAEASSELTRNNILLQASTATLSQANQVNNMALKLIG